MRVENFQPNTFTFVNIIHAAAQFAALRVRMIVQASLIRFGFCSHTSVGNSLVDMYAKCGMIESSERCFRIFREMLYRDKKQRHDFMEHYAICLRRSWSSKLCSVTLHVSARKRTQTRLCVLSACRHAGLVEEGKKMFKEMEERYKIEAEVEHYACMVDLLGKAGLFGEAVEKVRKMRVKANVGVWGALLSCSRMHCNLWLGNAAFCQLVKLEPLNPSHYVQDPRLRETCDGSRMKNVPACSWIQV